MDTTWYGTATAYWSAIEVNLAIICASTPALKPLIIKIIPRLATQRYGSATGDRKDTKDRKSFIELKGKTSQTRTSEDMEALAQPKPTLQEIHYTKEFEHRVEHV